MDRRARFDLSLALRVKFKLGAERLKPTDLGRMDYFFSAELINFKKQVISMERTEPEFACMWDGCRGTVNAACDGAAGWQGGAGDVDRDFSKRCVGKAKRFIPGQGRS
jgi:hypothetical protein